jgi:sirohydrochlorin ferrochelatase
VALPSFLRDIVGWLRAGYPDGVPDVDYIPLFALLGRHLTDDEVKEIADELAASDDAHSADAIHAAINNVTHEQPRDSEIDRVRARLAAGGWPLAKPGPG